NRFSGVRHREERDRNADKRKGRPHADGGLQPAAHLSQEKHGSAGHERQHHRRDHQVIAHAAHGCGSPPSTWSVPVTPRDASNTTRKSAVVAKLMTIAVRTSACVSGSAYCDGSPGARVVSTGGAPVRRRPIATMKRLTA